MTKPTHEEKSKAVIFSVLILTLVAHFLIYKTEVCDAGLLDFAILCMGALWIFSILLIIIFNLIYNRRKSVEEKPKRSIFISITIAVLTVIGMGFVLYIGVVLFFPL